MERKLPKALRGYLGLLAAVAVFCVVAACVWFGHAALVQQSRQAPRYLLKESGGYLALYSGDGQGPLAEYDIRVRMLPEQDVLALQQGVPVQDEAELQKMLEDYGL